MNKEIPRPVIVTNNPIESKEEDLFNLSVQIAELEEAISRGAGLIGIISPQGGGKTSLVRTLTEKKKEKEIEDDYVLQNICVWPYEEGSWAKQGKELEDCIRIFLYQFSKIVKARGFSRHINRMMSSNYRSLSWSVDIGKKQWLGLGCIFVVYAAIAILGTFYSEKDTSDVFQQIFRWAACAKNIAGYAAIGLGLLVCSYNSLIFSWKDSEDNRTFGEADAFEIFECIITRASKRKKTKYIINIEDLDRISDVCTIIEFLKMLYKYYYLIDGQDRSYFVFIVSLNYPAKLRDPKKKNDDELRKLASLFDKFFDYQMILRPINMEKIKVLLENLLMNAVNKIGADSDAVMEKDWQKDAAEWLTKGENLDMREIKVRTDKSLAIWDELRMMKDDNEWKDLSFQKCAIVVYLEQTYPLEMYDFICGAGAWGKIMLEFGKWESESGKKKEDFWKNWLGSQEITEAFKTDIGKIFSEEMSWSDYWIYFHRNPGKR